MAFTWGNRTSFGKLEGIQDPRQHWRLDPGGNEPIDPSTIVAFIFTFVDAPAYRTFASRFPPQPDARVENARAPTRDFTGVVFSAPAPIRVLDRFFATVGFAHLSEAGDIATAMNEGLGTVVTTGVPIEGDLVLSPGIDLPDFGNYSGPVHVVIDTEIAFANERFVGPDGRTRVVSFWDQGARPEPAQPMANGRVLSGARINVLRERYRQNGNVNEWALYADYDSDAHGQGAIRRLPGSGGHGSHVLDSFTGGAEFAHPGEVIPIVAIELPQWAVDETAGRELTHFVLLALLWIESWGAQVQAQINYSFGGIAGSHDGRDILEILFDDAIDSGDLLAVNIPYGNVYGSETHASFVGRDLAVPRVLEWNISPDDGTENILEVWLPERVPEAALANVALTVAAPTGEAITVDATTTGYYALQDGEGDVLARIYVSPAPSGQRRFISVIVRHTAPDRMRHLFAGGRPELAGGWHIGVQSINLTMDERVEIWIERDDLLARAKTGARQSRFTGPEPIWHDTPPGFDVEAVRNAGTLSDLSTGARTIVAAGHLRSSGQPAAYSSEGFDDPVRYPPTASAISDDSVIHAGVLGTGYFSGSTLAMAGTSVSSGLTARVAARLSLDPMGDPPTRPGLGDHAHRQYGRPVPGSKRINPVFGTYEGTPPETRIGRGCIETAWTRLPRFIE